MYNVYPLLKAASVSCHVVNRDMRNLVIPRPQYIANRPPILQFVPSGAVPRWFKIVM